MDTEQLDGEVSQVIGAAWSSNTLATRNSQWKKYFAFCDGISHPPLPASVQTISRFLVYLGRSCKYSTVNNYLSAVVGLHKFYGYSADFRDSFLIKMVLKGLQSTLGTGVTQMLLLTVSQFQDMFRCAVNSDMDRSIWAALMLSFRTLLRKSNIIPDTASNSRHVLCRKDLEFCTWGLMVHVRSTKTLQTGSYVLDIPVYYVENKCMCAASLVKEHVDSHPAHNDSPVFVKQGNSKTVDSPVLYRDVLAFIKSAVSMIGLDPSLYGTHSMRRSGSAFLHALGVPLEDIMVMGDWKSLAVLDYLVTPLSRKIELLVEKSLLKKSNMKI